MLVFFFESGLDFNMLEIKILYRFEMEKVLIIINYNLSALTFYCKYAYGKCHGKGLLYHKTAITNGTYSWYRKIC